MIQLKTTSQTLQLRGTTAPHIDVCTAANTVQLTSTGPRGPQGVPGRDGADGIGIQGPPGPTGSPGPAADPAALSAVSTRVDALTATVTAINNLAPEQLNAFSEVAQALNNDPAFAQTMTTALARRVRVDAAQALSSTERAVARENIDAASLASTLGKLDRTDYVRALQIIATGKPPAGSLIGGGIVPQAGTIDIQASSISADTGPAQNLTLTIRVNGAIRGTIAFAAGATVGVITFATAALSAGDRLSVYLDASDTAFMGLIGSLVVRL
ncbi:hypothetical protein U1701_00100 [Sphingomonas sp. PB2P19]|uniref:hypothetical protein n=1 Tax=Sphingomonas rhamnosi TaxID=3096156 RepID=UPI002FCA9F8D